MKQLLLAGAGGCLGSMARYLLGTAVQSTAGTAFPVGTVSVNVIGCLIIGAVMAAASVRGVVSEDVRVFLVVGVLGGFTTFSAFAGDSLRLAQERRLDIAIANVAVSVGFCLAAVWIGHAVAARFLR